MNPWRKSSHSDDNGCVSVRDDGDVIALRDDKDPDGPVLHFSRAEMSAWIAGCKAGEFDNLT
jgi:hypothetical protein